MSFLKENLDKRYFINPDLSEKNSWLFYFWSFLKFLSILLLTVFLILAIIFLVNLNKFLHIYHSALAGKEKIESAIVSLREKDFKQAEILGEQAAEDFAQALSTLALYQENFLIAKIEILRQPVESLVRLVQSGQILSQAASQTAVFAFDLSWFLDKEEFNFAKLNREEKRKLLKKIYESAPEMNGIKANLKLAIISLDKVHFNSLFWPLDNKVNSIKKQVSQVYDFLEMAVPISQLLPPVIGYPESAAYLLILQNSDELRPTGGFIGTYGILEMIDGDIKRLETHDIYHLDMPVKDLVNIEPPEPIKKYLVPKWYMRDANWSPDWPTTAEKLQWFYKLENELLPPGNQINNFFGDFNGVIGLTPKLVTRLLDLVGPVVVEGVEYNSENFVDLLQYRVEKGYVELGVPAWQRKEVIGEILKEVKSRLFDLSPDKLIGAIEIARVSLSEKNLLLYFNDTQMQAYAVSEGWAGEVKEVKGDYLMIIDANLGSYKTDAVISRRFDYRVREENSKLISDLKINYLHQGRFDWKTTRYRTYTRIYTPKGSRLISVDGFFEQPDVYEELDKTVFGGFMVIEPGEIGSLRLIYELPLTVKDRVGYQLLINKQPGVDSIFYTIDLNFNSIVKSYSPTGFYVSKDGGQVKWEGELTTDIEYLVNF